MNLAPHAQHFVARTARQDIGACELVVLTVVHKCCDLCRLASHSIAHVIEKAIDCAAGTLVDDGSSDDEEDTAGVVVDEMYGTTSPLSHTEVAGFQALQAMPPVAQVGWSTNPAWVHTLCMFMCCLRGR
jgi:hypothetical protein